MNISPAYHCSSRLECTLSGRTRLADLRAKSLALPRCSVTCCPGPGARSRQALANPRQGCAVISAVRAPAGYCYGRCTGAKARGEAWGTLASARPHQVRQAGQHPACIVLATGLHLSHTMPSTGKLRR